jgi:hypothetical protein
MDPNELLLQALDDAAYYRLGEDAADVDEIEDEDDARLFTAYRELLNRWHDESSPADWLLEIHRMLFPERYPREVQPDHVFWENHDESDCISTPEMGGAVFEWDSGTIELVAHMLERALADDPRARLKP